MATSANPPAPTTAPPLRAEPVPQEKEQEWREGFEAMGRDPDMDVEYLLPAAREVISGG